MDRVKLYFKNAVILTAAGLALRGAGMFLRVYVAARIGAEGMGLYQLVFTVYGLCSTVSTAGVSVAATRLAAEELARTPGCRPVSVMDRVVWMGVQLGTLAGLAQFLLAWPVARFWLGDLRAQSALRLLAPSLPFMGVSAALKGYFFALRKVGPGVRSQLLEQAVRMGLIFCLLPLAEGRPVGVVCAAIVIGNTVSEICSCLLLVYEYRREIRGMVCPEPPKSLTRKMWSIAAPVLGGRCLDSGLHTAENVLVPACLLVFLGSRQESLAQFGALKGMAMPLLLFPFSFLSPLSTLLLPEITQAHLSENKERLEKLIGNIFLYTSLFSVLAGGLVTLNGFAVGELLYHSREVGLYLTVLGPILPAMYLDSMGDAVLKGLGEEMATFRYSLWDSVLRIGLVLLLLPRYGMQGFLCVMACSNLLSALLNLVRIAGVTGIRLHWYGWFLRPVILFALAVIPVCKVFPGQCDKASWPGLILKAALLTVLFGLLCLLRCKELRSRKKYPAGKKLPAGR